MDSLCDPSTADVTGRILEAFGLVFKHTKQGYINEALLIRMNTASRHGIKYLQSTKEPTGAWYGRWGSNFIYGTSNVLCALEYYKHDRQVQDLIQPAVRWLKDVQNADGGWRESLYVQGRRTRRLWPIDSITNGVGSDGPACSPSING